MLCCCALGIPATPSLHVNAQRMYVICLGVCVCVWVCVCVLGVVRVNVLHVFLCL